MLLKAKRRGTNREGFLFQGRRLPPGTEIDTNSFPDLREEKIAQLVNRGWFSIVGVPGGEMARALREHLDEYGSRPGGHELPKDHDVVLPEVPRGVVPHQEETASPSARPPDSPDATASVVCGDCGHEAKNEQGLKVHRGRKHKE